VRVRERTSVSRIVDHFRLHLYFLPRVRYRFFSFFDFQDEKTEGKTHTHTQKKALKK
jgi:hypothetical protein